MTLRKKVISSKHKSVTKNLSKKTPQMKKQTPGMYLKNITKPSSYKRIDMFIPT